MVVQTQQEMPSANRDAELAEAQAAFAKITAGLGNGANKADEAVQVASLQPAPVGTRLQEDVVVLDPEAAALRTGQMGSVVAQAKAAIREQVAADLPLERPEVSPEASPEKEKPLLPKPRKLDENSEYQMEVPNPGATREEIEVVRQRNEQRIGAELRKQDFGLRDKLAPVLDAADPATRRLGEQALSRVVELEQFRTKKERAFQKLDNRIKNAGLLEGTLEWLSGESLTLKEDRENTARVLGVAEKRSEVFQANVDKALSLLESGEVKAARLELANALGQDIVDASDREPGSFRAEVERATDEGVKIAERYLRAAENYENIGEAVHTGAVIGATFAGGPVSGLVMGGITSLTLNTAEAIHNGKSGTELFKEVGWGTLNDAPEILGAGLGKALATRAMARGSFIGTGLGFGTPLSIIGAGRQEIESHSQALEGNRAIDAARGKVRIQFAEFLKANAALGMMSAEEIESIEIPSVGNPLEQISENLRNRFIGSLQNKVDRKLPQAAENLNAVWKAEERTKDVNLLSGDHFKNMGAQVLIETPFNIAGPIAGRYGTNLIRNAAQKGVIQQVTSRIKGGIVNLGIVDFGGAVANTAMNGGDISDLGRILPVMIAGQLGGRSIAIANKVRITPDAPHPKASSPESDGEGASPNRSDSPDRVSPVDSPDGRGSSDGPDPVVRPEEATLRGDDPRADASAETHSKSDGPDEKAKPEGGEGGADAGASASGDEGPAAGESRGEAPGEEGGRTATGVGDSPAAEVARGPQDILLSERVANITEIAILSQVGRKQVRALGGGALSLVESDVTPVQGPRRRFGFGYTKRVIKERHHPGALDSYAASERKRHEADRAALDDSTAVTEDARAELARRGEEVTALETAAQEFELYKIDIDKTGRGGRVAAMFSPRETGNTPALKHSEFSALLRDVRRTQQQVGGRYRDGYPGGDIFVDTSLGFLGSKKCIIQQIGTGKNRKLNILMAPDATMADVKSAAQLRRAMYEMPNFSKHASDIRGIETPQGQLRALERYRGPERKALEMVVTEGVSPEAAFEITAIQRDMARAESKGELTRRGAFDAWEKAASIKQADLQARIAEGLGEGKSVELERGALARVETQLEALKASRPTKPAVLDQKVRFAEAALDSTQVAAGFGKLEHGAHDRVFEGNVAEFTRIKEAEAEAARTARKREREASRDGGEQSKREDSRDEGPANEHKAKPRTRAAGPKYVTLDNLPPEIRSLVTEGFGAENTRFSNLKPEQQGGFRFTREDIHRHIEAAKASGSIDEAIARSLKGTATRRVNRDGQTRAEWEAHEAARRAAAGGGRGRRGRGDSRRSA